MDEPSNKNYQFLNLKDFYSSIKSPYKFGNLNINIKHNNVFVNLKSKKMKTVHKLSAGSLQIKNVKKKTTYCKEKVILAVLLRAVALNYKILDFYCKRVHKYVFRHIFTAIKKSGINIRFFHVKHSNIHGSIRLKKRRKK